MTHRHSILCVALSVAVTLKLLAGTANAAGDWRPLGSWTTAEVVAMTWPTGRPIIVTDMSNPVAPVQPGRGVDAAIDGEIVGPGS